MNQPQTFEGVQVWDLVGRLGGQLRATRQIILGWDMGAALAMAHALGINGLAAMELLPEIEAIMVKRVNEQIGAQDGR
jgi:pimeloyl-ACP methyl ester carboxylesterase